MAPLASTRSIIRRLTDPEQPRIAVSLMVLASAMLFGAVFVALPTPAEGSDTVPVVDVPEGPRVNSLLDGPTEIVLPAPDGERHETSVFVNHRRAQVSVDARLANGEGLTVELSEAGPRATRVHVVSEALHRCDRYAGTLILEATHPEHPSDLSMLDVRFAPCAESVAAMAAPDSVDDVDQTWGDEGRAPWKPAPGATPPPPPSPQPPPPPPAPAEEPAPAEPASADEPAPAEEPAPTSDPTPTTEPDPTTDPAPQPTGEPSPTTEPEPEPTGDPSPTTDPEPEPTSDPSPTSEPEPTSDPSPTSTSSETTTSSPTASPTSTAG